MRLSAAVLLALAGLAALTACGDPVPGIPTDASVRRDASGMDAASIDAGDPDAGDVDADTDADAARDDAGAPDAQGVDADFEDATVDASEPDAFIELPDGGPCFFADGGRDFCACDAPIDCSTTPCAAGFACIAGACGMRCVAAGGRCGDDTDCPDGSTCTAGACARAGGGCSDSRDCPTGYACESGACRDRRLRCGGLPGEQCPHGFRCISSGVGVPLCTRVTRPCATSAGCGINEICSDVDGDGDAECIARGACDENADCPARQTCEFDTDRYNAGCGGHGPCRTAADCPTGSSCVDLWGDGIRECVEAGGSCARTSECPGTSVCGSPLGGGAPRCVDRPYL